MELKSLKFELEAPLAWIRFNRPEKLNALNPDVLRELETVIARVESDETVRVVVLTGNEKAFVAGTDIEHMARGGINLAYELADLVMRVQERLADLPKPTLAAVSGYALGGGCELALCCDFRLAATNAVFGQPEINLGLIPGGGGTQRLPRLVGLAPAAELIFLGERITADRAEQLGLVNKVVALDQLEAEARAWGRKLAEKPALALRAAKTALRKGLSASLKEGLQLEQDLFAMLFGTEDRKEGLTAFLEKRKPVFKGR
ncbi:MAG: enoyl-CoA hydratase [Thermodesulfobacteriota bacterium]